MKKHDEPTDTMDIGCLEAIENFYAWLDDEIKDPDAIRQLEEHIRHCDSCYSRAEMERALTHHIRQVGRMDDPGPSLDALKDRLRKIVEE